MCANVAHSVIHSSRSRAAARARLFSLFSRPAKTRREINFCPRARLHCAEIMPAWHKDMRDTQRRWGCSWNRVRKEHTAEHFSGEVYEKNAHRSFFGHHTFLCTIQNLVLWHKAFTTMSINNSGHLKLIQGHVLLLPKPKFLHFKKIEFDLPYFDEIIWLKKFTLKIAFILKIVFFLGSNMLCICFLFGLL